MRGFEAFFLSLAFLGGRGRRPDGEVSEREPGGLAMEGDEGILQFEQRPAGQLQLMLVGLIERSFGVIEEGCSRLLDVIAEDLGDGLAAGELNQAGNAGYEFGKVMNIETAGIERIAGKQNGCFAVVKGDACGRVAGNGNRINHAVAKINAADIVRPMSDVIEAHVRVDL